MLPLYGSGLVGTRCHAVLPRKGVLATLRVLAKLLRRFENPDFVGIFRAAEMVLPLEANTV